MMPPEQVDGIDGTVVTREHPYSPQDSDHYEYPFPDERNQKLYDAYRSRVAAHDRLMICGRLGEYRYFDMDQAIGRALRIARVVLRASSATPSKVIAQRAPQAELLLNAGRVLATNPRRNLALNDAPS
jgi:hypothetical protein